MKEKAKRTSIIIWVPLQARPMVLKEWPLDQQPQASQGTC